MQKSRRYRRVVYDQEKWKAHRSTDRYILNIASMPSSRILRALAGPLTWVVAVASAICFYDTLAEEPSYSWLPQLEISNPQPQVLTSFALSLLLVFRTNTGYARWDEARKIWGGVLNHSRSTVQMACAFFTNDGTRRAMARWTMAHALALKAHLQEDADLRADLTQVLEPAEVEMLMASNHRVVRCLQIMNELIQQEPLSIWQAEMMMKDISFFYDAVGGCERILKTPIPLSYTRHTCRFMLIWLTSLPFGIFSQFHWATVPITFIIALLLLGIDEIGVEIEEPFGILPLDAIASRVEIDAKQLLAEHPDTCRYVAEIRAARDPVYEPVIASRLANE